MKVFYVKINEHRFWLLFLLLTGMATYLPSLAHDFVPLWDDTMYVLANSAVMGFSFDHLCIAFTKNYSGNYAPLHIISYMVDYTLWGMKPAGFIFTNILLHVINGMLFYGLMVRSRFEKLTACAAAFIFLLHPVQVESVVWISQRKTVLAMTFFLLSFHEYFSWRYSEEQKKTMRHYLFSLGCFLLALLSKSVVVILPLVLLLYDLSYVGAVKPALRFRDKIPYAVLAIAVAILTYFWQDPSQLGGRRDFHGGSPMATLYTMLPVMMKYLELLFWPTGLSPRYDIPVRSGFDESVLLGGVAVSAFFVAGIWLFRRRRDLFCWYALFFVGLLPVSQIIPIVTLMNDRYLYFPMLGGAAFVCIIVQYFVQKQQWEKEIATVCCGVLLVLPVLTYNQTKTWQNSLTVWQQVVKHNPLFFDARLFLADEYLRQGRSDEALSTSLVTLERFPDDPTPLRLIAMLYANKLDILNARKYLELASVAYPADIELKYLLAENYRTTKNIPEARAVYLDILMYSPGSDRALKALSELGD